MSGASDLRTLRPEHLYKSVALLFLLGLAYRFFDPLSRVLLLVYAAVILAVALNAVVRRVPLGRGWTAALLAVLLLGATVAGIWLGGSALLRQAGQLADSFPTMEREEWGDVLTERWTRRAAGGGENG